MKSKVKKRNYGLWLVASGLWLFISNPASSSFPLSHWERHQRGSRQVLSTSSSMKMYFPPTPNSPLPLMPRGGPEFLTPYFQGRASPLTAKKPKENLRQGVACSDQDIETLTTQLLRDLPSYANRAIQRARPPLLSKTPDLYSYMLVAGKPEFTPLLLNPDGYSTDTLKTTDQEIKQVFFTTLERQYIQGKAVDLQQFHRLFLTKTKSGWRVVMMFSEIGYYPAKAPPTPPRDSSNGDIAQGINAWFRDCQAGSVRVRSANLKG